MGNNTGETVLKDVSLLPLEIISWGSMLSLSEKALLTDGWWIILIPGAFLVVTLLCITGIGDYLRRASNKQESNL